MALEWKIHDAQVGKLLNLPDSVNVRIPACARSVSRGFARLIDPRQGLDLQFQRLRVLLFDLHFGLQLLYEQLEPRYFRAQFLHINRSHWPLLRSRRR